MKSHSLYLFSVYVYKYNNGIYLIYLSDLAVNTLHQCSRSNIIWSNHSFLTATANLVIAFESIFGLHYNSATISFKITVCVWSDIKSNIFSTLFHYMIDSDSLVRENLRFLICYSFSSVNEKVFFYWVNISSNITEYNAILDIE